MPYYLSLLPALACPIGMGLLLWLMRRGNVGRAMPIDPLHGDQGDARAGAETSTHVSSCVNWKVLAGLAALALGTWVLAPTLLGVALPLLIVLACPISMLLMLWGMRGGQCATHAAAGVGLTDTEHRARLRREQAARARAVADRDGSVGQTVSRVEGGIRGDVPGVLNRS